MASFFESVAEQPSSGEAPPPAGEPIPAGETQQPAPNFFEKVKEAEAGTLTITPPDIKMERELREEFLASQVEQQELGEPGLEDFGIRFDIGLSSTFEEKKLKFLDSFPSGDFIRVRDFPGPFGEIDNQVVLFRKNRNEAFAKLDADSIEKFEMLGDIADLSADIPAAVAEIAVVRGGRLVSQLLKVFGITATAEVTNEAIESLRGFQKETMSRVLQRAAQKGVFATAGAGASIIVSGPLNMVRGAKSLETFPGAGAAQRAAAELDLPGLLPNQVIKNPLIQKIGGQSGAIVKKIGNYIQDQQAAVVQALLRLKRKDLARFNEGDFLKLHEDAKVQILKAASEAPQTLGQGGSTLQTGIVEYNDLAKMLTKSLYQVAEAVEVPKFDIAPMVRMADDISGGLPAAARPEMGAAQATVQLRNTQQALLREIDKIKTINPDLPPLAKSDGTVITATDQLRQIRSNLWDLKTPEPGQIARQEHIEAGRLYGAINKVLKDPVNTSPEFRKAYADANQAAASRFDTMDKLMVVQSSRSETPTILAQKLAQPNQIDNLLVLKKALSGTNIMQRGQNWTNFQKAVKSDFIAPENVDGLTKRMNSFDKPTLDLLMSKSDQSAMRRIGREIDRLNDTGIQQAVREQTTLGGAINRLSETKNTQQIETLLAVAREGTGARRQIRSGMLGNLYDAAVVKEKGVRSINAKVIQATVKSWKESGAWKFLTPKDRFIIKNLNSYVEFIPTTADTGTSLIAGQAASQARQIGRELLTGSVDLATDAASTVIEHMGVGGFFTSRLGQRILVGKQVRPRAFQSLRGLGAFLAVSATEFEKDKETPLLPPENNQ